MQCGDLVETLSRDSIKWNCFGEVDLALAELQEERFKGDGQNRNDGKKKTKEKDENDIN